MVTGGWSVNEINRLRIALVLVKDLSPINLEKPGDVELTANAANAVSDTFLTLLKNIVIGR